MRGRSPREHDGRSHFSHAVGGARYMGSSSRPRGTSTCRRRLVAGRPTIVWCEQVRLGFESGSMRYVDPPYLVHGDDLYLDTLTWADHAEVATELRKSPCPWMLTYDADPRVTDQLYTGFPVAEFDIAHTAQRQHVGT